MHLSFRMFDTQYNIIDNNISVNGIICKTGLTQTLLFMSLEDKKTLQIKRSLETNY